MRTLTNSKAEMFDKALGDLWIAKQIYKGRSDYAAWHCEQCIEKILKGVLLCYEREYDHTHNIADLLETCVELQKFEIDEETHVGGDDSVAPSYRKPEWIEYAGKKIFDLVV